MFTLYRNSLFVFKKVDPVDWSGRRRLQREQHERETIGSSRARGNRPPKAEINNCWDFTI